MPDYVHAKHMKNMNVESATMMQICKIPQVFGRK